MEIHVYFVLLIEGCDIRLLLAMSGHG